MCRGIDSQAHAHHCTRLSCKTAAVVPAGFLCSFGGEGVRDGSVPVDISYGTDVAPSLYAPGGLGRNGFDLGLHLSGRYVRHGHGKMGFAIASELPTPIPSTVFAMHPVVVRLASMFAGDLRHNSDQAGVGFFQAWMQISTPSRIPFAHICYKL